jgi:RecB family endonuclease NucS
LWLENGSSVAIIEVKHTVHPKALDQLARQMQRVREFCPEYKDYKLYGGIAGFSIPDEVAEEAKARGMFILKCKGDILLTDASSMRSF